VSSLSPYRFVTHGRQVQTIASRLGWRPGARYTNLRDVRHLRFKSRGFLDIHWKQYCFASHLSAAKRTRPHITVARDIEDIGLLDEILCEAQQLRRYARHVVIVPKDPRLGRRMESRIPKDFLLGYSCPTRYGGTTIPPDRFIRPVHILGGRPDVQRRLADAMPVYSFDCNRFTLDAAFGYFFDGQRFRLLEVDDYEACIQFSIEGINSLWTNYRRPNP
jgi:hypothetical protein